MTDDLPPVLRLGHDLVRNFEVLPPDAAAEAIEAHIRKFWEPRMRRELTAFVEAGDPRLDALLARAAEGLLEGDPEGREVSTPPGR